MGLPLINSMYYDNSSGLNLKDSPTKLAESDASLTLNMDYSTDGSTYSRFGSNIQNDGHQMDQLNGLGSYDYKKSDGTQVSVVQNGSKIYHSLTNPVAAVTGLDPSAIPDMEFQVTNDDEYLIWGNGVDTNLKFNGTTWTNLSIATPVVGMTATEINLGGGGLPNGDYTYVFAYVRQVAGIPVQFSDLSPEVSVTVVAGPSDVFLNAIPISLDPQVTHKIIYRRSPTSFGVFYELATITNATISYTDTSATDGTIEASFDNQPAPTAAIFEEYLGCMNYVSTTNRAWLYESIPDNPWNVPTENYEIFDGPIQCVKRVYGVLFIGTDRSIWVRNGRYQDGNTSKRISSSIGILNNRCADGLSYLYFIGTNFKFYGISPTDFSNEQLRLDEPLSRKVEPLISQISKSLFPLVNIKYYTKANVSKLMISGPFNGPTNNKILIYNETQAHARNHPVWQFWDNINAATMQMFTFNGAANLYTTDNNGFIWKIDDETTNGDGAEINGTATGGSNTTLVDNFISSTATGGGANTLIDASLTMTNNQYSFYYLQITGGTGAGQNGTILTNNATTFTMTAPWGVVPDATSIYKVGQFPFNGLVGINVDLIGGTGEGQSRTIISNDVDTLTISTGLTNWGTNPDNTTEFTVGGYDCYHFSNWKNVNGSYDALKQLWYMWANLDSLGNYTIQMILQYDFDETLANAQIINVNLAANNGIWGVDTWLAFFWARQRVFQTRIRKFGRFRAIRVGWRNQKAGQPFQVNGYTVSCQDKKLFYASGV